MIKQIQVLNVREQWIESLSKQNKLALIAVESSILSLSKYLSVQYKSSKI